MKFVKMMQVILEEGIITIVTAQRNGQEKIVVNQVSFFKESGTRVLLNGNGEIHGKFSIMIC